MISSISSRSTSQLLLLLLTFFSFTSFGSAAVLRYCTEKNYGGECKYDIGCVNLNPTYYQKVSSIQVEPGYKCVFYTADDCNPPSAFARKVFAAGDYVDLAGYDNLFRSYYCYKSSA